MTLKNRQHYKFSGGHNTFLSILKVRTSTDPSSRKIPRVRAHTMGKFQFFLICLAGNSRFFSLTSFSRVFFPHPPNADPTNRKRHAENPAIYTMSKWRNKPTRVRKIMRVCDTWCVFSRHWCAIIIFGSGRLFRGKVFALQIYFYGNTPKLNEFSIPPHNYFSRQR